MKKTGKKIKLKLRKRKFGKIFNINRLYYIILLPLVLTVILIIGNNSLESRGIYIFLLIALFWMFELLPFPVTSFFPVILYPLFGISDVRKICRNYMTSPMALFFGSVLFSVAIEHCNLHKRIALKILIIMGTRISRLMLGCMLATMFISMWIMNTMATATMVPIVEAIIDELYVIANENKLKSQTIEKKERNINENISNDFEISEIEAKAVESETQINEISKTKKSKKSKKKHHRDKESKIIAEQYSRLRTVLTLSVSIASNCGGSTTLIGTATTLVFVRSLEYNFPDSKDITFISWMSYNLPTMLISVILNWLYMLYVEMKYNKDSQEELVSKETIIDKYENLGKITFHEAAVLGLYIFVTLAWFFRDPQFMPGWLGLIQEKRSNFRVTDASPGILICFLLFLIPTKPKQLSTSRPLLSWEKVQKKMTWNVMIIFGGGMALSEGFKDSGLNKLLENSIKKFSNVPNILIMMIMCLMATVMTQIITNLSIISILLPTAKELALTRKVNPLFFMLPLTVSCSFAFVLPVGTPPNAIVYEALNIKLIEMAKPGIVAALICLMTEYIMILTWGNVVFDFSKYPAWAAGRENL